MGERYDVAIIGTGPAGISAAITLTIRNKKILLLGSSRSSVKVEKAHEIQNYPGLPAIGGAELAERFLTHLEQMDITITEDPVATVYAMGDFYSIQSKSNQMYEATAVIVASGVDFGKPYPGEEEFLGRGVSYCATCDAPLYKGKTVTVIGSSKKEEAEANFLKEVAEKVTYIPLYPEEVQVDEGVEVIREKVVGIEGKFKANCLRLENSSLETDCIFILRESVSPKALIPGIEMDGNHIAVNRKMETSLKGCFACGDITGAPYQYIKAAGEGNVAAISAVEYLNQKKAENKKA